jgi:hypothetical protein
MLGSLKRSPEYDAVRKRVSDPKPLDAWRIGDENFFVFALESSPDIVARAAFALSKMRWDQDGPQLALVITRRDHAREVQVSDVRSPEHVRMVSLEEG